jgi:type IV pilus assembly protein PilY1
VEAVYGGDLYGNLWRFDVNKTLGEAQLLAVLKDGSSNLQPITTKPEVAMVPKANAIVVYIGTGRFLAAADANDLSQQTIYAIKDPVEAIATATPAATLSTAIYDNPRALASFVQQIQAEVACPSGTASFICAANSMVRTSTSNTVEFASDTGWYVDLIGTAERANTDLKIALGGLYFNTNAPTLAACDVGGKSYQYFLDYKSGSAVKSPGTNGVVGKFLANELASTITLVMAGDGTMRSISGLSGGGIDVGQPPLPPEAWVTRRTSWRELIRE